MKKQWAMAVLAAALALAGCEATAEQDRHSLDRGYDQYNARQYDAAAGVAAGYIAQHPNDPALDEAYYLRGLARMGMGPARRGGGSADGDRAVESGRFAGEGVSRARGDRL